MGPAVATCSSIRAIPFHGSLLVVLHTLGLPPLSKGFDNLSQGPAHAFLRERLLSFFPFLLRSVFFTPIAPTFATGGENAQGVFSV
jgi:hypothetical protein